MECAYSYRSTAATARTRKKKSAAACRLNLGATLTKANVASGVHSNAFQPASSGDSSKAPRQRTTPDPPGTTHTSKTESKWAQKKTSRYEDIEMNIFSKWGGGGDGGEARVTFSPMRGVGLSS